MDYLKNLLTYEEASQIVRDNKFFQELKRTINGYDVRVFDYIASSYPDFIKPTDKHDKNALELRGLVFVKQDDGSWKRFLAMHKFFNLNENESTQEVKYEGKDLIYHEKLDGSMISFYSTPDGEIHPKTRIGFDNDQTNLAKEVLLEKPELSLFIEECLRNELSPIFEIISFKNKIIVSYSETELRLLQLRDKDGNYLDLKENSLVKKYNVKIIEAKSGTIKELKDMKKDVQGIEGWIVNSGGDLFKVKTDWYMKQSRLVDHILKANGLLALILEDKIDDVVSEIEVGSPNRVVAIKAQAAVNQYLVKRAQDVKELVLIAKSMDRKYFSIKHKSDLNFHVAAKLINNPDFESRIVPLIKKELLKQNLKLRNSEKFFLDIGFDINKELSTLGSGLRG